MKEHSARADHHLHVIPNYGHLDMFVGRQAQRDVFPTILQEVSDDHDGFNDG
jgi:hypothetical protein